MTSMQVIRIMPVFPREALSAGVNGAVVMHVVIGTDGHVEAASVVSGPEMLRASYLAAVRQWVYMPFVLNGKKVRVDTTVVLSLDMGSDKPIEPMPAGAFGNGYGSKVPTAESGKRVRISSGVMAGQILKRIMPNYPAFTQKDHISGATTLHIVIGRDGKVNSVEAVSGPIVRRKAEIDAVRQWEYKPYLLNGEATEVETTVTLQPSFGG